MIGLPSLQAMDRAQETRIWLASEAMDMRCGFDRLAERVRAVIGEDPLSGHWFVFHSHSVLGPGRIRIVVQLTVFTLHLLRLDPMVLIP
ncbi:MAG: hypothetical protein DMG50_23300 [Acidobacteria bacterium]|nr:MAG: hypothetical protein DMG50_23300 [Acidobacteriota bacterium]